MRGRAGMARRRRSRDEPGWQGGGWSGYGAETGRDGEAEAGRDTGRIWGGEMTCSAVFTCGLQLRMALIRIRTQVSISCLNKNELLNQGATQDHALEAADLTSSHPRLLRHYLTGYMDVQPPPPRPTQSLSQHLSG